MVVLVVGESDFSVNPVKGDVSDSHLNAGGGRFDHPLEINEGVP